MVLLIFTDQRVVDHNCNTLSDSNLKYQNLDSKRISLNHLLLQNVPGGCTMMMNHALVDLSRPIPAQAVMHDHWVGLTAAIFGKIIYLDEPTMLYRQHDTNYYGAPKYGWGHFYHRYRQGINAARDRLHQYIDQATALRDRFSGRLQPEVDELLRDFSSLKTCSWMKRRRILIKHRIFKTAFDEFRDVFDCLREDCRSSSFSLFFTY